MGITQDIAGYCSPTKFNDLSDGKRLNSYKRGFHPSGICGTLKARAASSKSLGLQEEGILNAIGISGSQPTGIHRPEHGKMKYKALNLKKAESVFRSLTEEFEEKSMSTEKGDNDDE